ncbi:hypothetical protein B0I08_101585 [Glaciihabitans tibetensis]|uniref:Lipoprotein LpqN n=1 Tax=Glaciihabitans tibetensis TaxID=1266600 RepID=A0A2T0VJT4_9MICO|nr:hypothetical protein [Glaciihabitans tibetensis]PRY70449.1 hypothetical protein B0I08_101585 [Glaciihabitans tibetensis]
MRALRTTRIVSWAAVALVAVSSLTACGAPPWTESSATPTPTPVATSPAPIEVIVNDLATGSVQRSLSAGAIALSVDYYSTLTMDKWTAAANKPLTFNLKGSLLTDDGQQIYISRVSLVVGVNGPLGPLAAPPTISDLATVSPGYPMKDPYTYNQTFILPAVDETATSLTLSFTYELLLQTTPTSTEYAKQTAADTLTIALATEPAEG